MTKIRRQGAVIDASDAASRPTLQGLDRITHHYVWRKPRHFVRTEAFDPAGPYWHRDQRPWWRHSKRFLARAKSFLPSSAMANTVALAALVLVIIGLVAQ